MRNFVKGNFLRHVANYCYNSVRGTQSGEKKSLLSTQSEPIEAIELKNKNENKPTQTKTTTELLQALRWELIKRKGLYWGGTLFLLILSSVAASKGIPYLLESDALAGKITQSCSEGRDWGCVPPTPFNSTTCQDWYNDYCEHDDFLSNFYFIAGLIGLSTAGVSIFTILCCKVGEPRVKALSEKNSTLFNEIKQKLGREINASENLSGLIVELEEKFENSGPTYT